MKPLYDTHARDYQWEHLKHKWKMIKLCDNYDDDRNFAIYYLLSNEFIVK